MAQAAASSVNKEMEISMERLSTGKRINSAADDAAGVAIASRLTAEITGTNQAIRNTMDAQALIDTAEGASLEVENILQRMRELAVQASSDTNSSADRTSMDLEYEALKNEIDRISSVTTWAGQSLLAATTTTGTQFNFHIGSGTSANNDYLTVTVTGLKATEIGSTVSVESTDIAASAGVARTAIGVLDAAIADMSNVSAFGTDLTI